MNLKTISSSSSSSSSVPATVQLLLFVCLVLNGCSSQSSYSRTNTSNLCSRSPPAALQSCAHQLSLLNPQSCLVQQTDYSLTTDGNQCNWPDTNHLNPSPQENDVDLQVYRHELPRIPLYRTALNLTLANIQQSPDSPTAIRVRYRYMLSDDFAFCINFTLEQQQQQQQMLLLPSHQSLWFDCVFFKRFYEGKPFIMEMVHGDKYSMFSFLIPTEPEIGEGFVYIHLHHLPHQLIATFQRSPGSNESDYVIVVCQWNEQGQCESIDSPLQIDLRNNSSYLYRRKDLVTVQVVDNKNLADGNYSVTVTSAISYRATSPFFTVKNSRMTTSLIVCIFILLLTALLFFGCIFAYWKNCDNDKKMRKMNKKNRTRVKMLLVYDPMKTDPNWLQALRIFLEKLAGYQVWLDSIEIPKSLHKDPLVWYSTAVDQADIVAVVLSPAPPHITPCIYTGTYQLALELISSQIASRCKSTATVLKRFVVVESSATTTAAASVPSMCTSFKRFRFPIEAVELIRYVDGERSSRRLFIDCLFDHQPLTKDTRLFPTQSFELIYSQLLLQQQQQSVDSPLSSITTTSSSTEQCHLLMDDDVEAMNRHQLDLDFGSTITAVTSLPSVTNKPL